MRVCLYFTYVVGPDCGLTGTDALVVIGGGCTTYLGAHMLRRLPNWGELASGTTAALVVPHILHRLGAVLTSLVIFPIILLAAQKLTRSARSDPETTILHHRIGSFTVGGFLQPPGLGS